MDRRHFLKSSAFFTVAAASSVLLAPQPVKVIACASRSSPARIDQRRRID